MKVIYRLNYQFNKENINYEKKYNFVPGRKYDVMGQCIFNSNPNMLYFLIQVNNTIEWFPEFLFMLSDKCNKIPFNWYMDMDSDVYTFLMGYYELVNEKGHFGGLQNNRKEDIKTFEKRYKELKEWERRLDYYNNEITYEDILSKIDFQN